MSIPEFFISLFSNKLFLSVLIAGVFAQALKVLIFSLKYKQSLRLEDIVVTGRMPSMHSAVVCALAVSAGLEGINNIFVVSLVLAAIVLRDSMGVRRTVGEQGKVINKIIKESKLKIDETHYSVGHKPVEVLAGIAIGVLSAIIVSLL